MESPRADDRHHAFGAPSLIAALRAASRRWRVAVLLTWLVGGLLYLATPPSPDQFNHGYLGWRLLAGDRPYVDVIDMNWPGVMALQALALALFGHTIWAWRALDLLLFAAAALALADLLRQAVGTGSDRAARAVLLWSLPFYLAFGYWMAGQHDMTAAQCMLMAAWCHVRGLSRPGWRWPAAAGALMALAVLNKPTVGMLLPALAVQMLWLQRPWRTAAVGVVVMGLAFFAVVGAAFGAVLALGTPPADLVEVILTFNTASTAGKPPTWLALLAITGWWPAGLLLLCLPAVVALGGAWRSVAASSLLWMVLAGTVSYLVQGKGLHYHHAPFVLVGIGLLALTVDSGLQALRMAGGPAGTRWLVVLAAAGVLLAGGLRLVTAYRGLPGAIASGDPTPHLARFRENDGLTVADAWTFARAAKAGQAGDCVLAVGTSSAVNFLATRPQPTRFYYFPVISALLPGMPMAQRWGKLWDDEIGASRCTHVLVAARVWVHEDFAVPRQAAASLKALLDAHYVEAGPLGDRGLVHYVLRR